MSRGQVSLIDIAPFLHGTTADKKRVATELDKACQDIGFLLIKGHDVPDRLIEDMYGVSGEYFALPYWEKMRLKMPVDRYRGHSPLRSQNLAFSLDKEAPNDLKEAYAIGPVQHAYDAYHHGPGSAQYFAPNMWPDRPAGMREIWEAYYGEMERLSADLMRIFAVALGMPEAFFQDKIDKHITIFGANNYPGQVEPPLAGQLRAGAHSDYGSLTIVHTDTDIGGLEVETKDGAWESVPHIPGTFVVNLGDLMADWTNDRWVSTLHRVTNPPHEKAHLSKTSFLFFHQPNYDAVVECLPTCCGPDNPAKYDRTTSGEHLTMKITKQRVSEGTRAAE